MSKKEIEASKDDKKSLFKIKSYSINEILAAGGTTAFADKMGKSWERLIEKLEQIPKEDFLTEEEFEEAMKTLNQSK